MGTKKQTQIVAQWSDAAAFDELIEVERTLTKHAGKAYDVDGHDIGSGTFNVFMYAPDAKVAYAVAKITALFEAGWLREGMKIGVAQYTDATRTDWVFKPVYPAGLKSFELL